LLAEDNPINQKVVVRILSRAGHAVDIVASGGAAIEALHGESYDLVFMDVQMPEMDGLAATRRIREDARFDDVPIIALTAHVLDGDRNRCLAAGMNDYLAKPFDQDELLAKVNEWAEPEGDGRPGATETAGPGKREAAEAIDMRALVEIVDGDVEFAESLVAEFLAYAERQLDEMDEAVASGDGEEVANLAHSIRGGAANLVAQQLQEAAASMETVARTGDLAGLPQLLGHLTAELARLREWAQEHLSVARVRSGG